MSAMHMPPFFVRNNVGLLLCSVHIFNLFIIQLESIIDFMCVDTDGAFFWHNFFSLKLKKFSNLWECTDRLVNISMRMCNLPFRNKKKKTGPDNCNETVA